MRDLSAVQRKYVEAGKLGPVARMVPTTAAATLRHSAGETIVMDGPFAETRNSCSASI